MRSVLVGTDGSVNAQAAVRWAQAMARATGAELLVTHAWHVPFIEAPPAVHAELRAEAERRLSEEWAAVDVGVSVRTRVLEGDPRATLLALGDDEDVDLIVVGARGHGSHPHALHLGSVTHHLVHHTGRPLVAVPATARAAFPTPVVVGVDGSPGSTRAVDWCRTVGPAVASEVIAVHAEMVTGGWVPRWDPERWYQQALHECDDWIAPLRGAGVVTRTRVLVHEPVAALAETGVEEQAGMVVVGARGRGGITGLRLGSTALGVLHRGGLPVVLVP